jgi:serine/threonine-protein kinase
MMSPQSLIAHYRIISKLGEGGMGEVWRATDTKLNRDVAIKILPGAFAQDADRMARFEREAQVLASLNHPNIAAIYGVEERALIMELVEGETLHGPLPVETALNYAKQIAKAMSNEPASGDPTTSPTLTMRATMAGTILGTAAYMSPEQARGKTVDKRADIWAFGVVLYEMLTGAQLFQGETISDTLAAVLTKEPDWNRVPVKPRRLLQRCLEKDPKRRLRDVGDASLLMDEVPPPQAPPAKSNSLPWAAAAGLFAIIAATALWGPWRDKPSPQPMVRLDVDLGSDVSFGALNWFRGADAILSPDGTRLVYCSQSRLFTRRLDQPKATELVGTEDAHSPFFSPDGQWVAFFATGKLKKVSVQGGTPILLSSAPLGSGGSWGPDGNIISAFGFSSALLRIPDSGGAPSPLTELAPGETAHRWPQILPGGKAVLFTAFTGSGAADEANVEVMSLNDRRPKILLRGGTYGRCLPTDHLIYIHKGTLFAMPFDLGRLETRGTPLPVLEEVAHNIRQGSAQFDFSQAGTAVYRSGKASDELDTVQWLDASGGTQSLLTKPGEYLAPRLSPDGKRLVVSSAGDLWVYELQRETMTHLTPGIASYPTWTPDGRYIVFRSIGGISCIRSDGSGEPKQLTQSNGNAHFPMSFTADGKRLAFTESNREGILHIWTVPVESDGAGLRAGKPEVFLPTPFESRSAHFSADGRWLAYSSNESGTEQVYVRAFPENDHKWQISNGGGMFPIFSPNGRELFFRNLTNQVMVAAYTVKGADFVAEKPRMWSAKQMANIGGQSNYDLAPDGKRIVALMPVESPETEKARSHVTFLFNFFDELRRKVPLK